jgi:hypothetical protein
MQRSRPGPPAFVTSAGVCPNHPPGGGFLLTGPPEPHQATFRASARAAAPDGLRRVGITISSQRSDRTCVIVAISGEPVAFDDAR